MDNSADFMDHVLKRLDPLTIRLYGMTSNANRAHVRQIITQRCPYKAVYSICTLLDTYGTVSLLEWADPLWPRDGHNKDTSRALENRNFETAAWLIEKKAYRRKGLWTCIKARDYETMDWCYAHGFTLHERYLTWVKEDYPDDQYLLTWFEGKNIKRPPPPVQYRRYPEVRPVGYKHTE